MHALLVVLTSLGLFAVGLCFIILLPNVGALLPHCSVSLLESEPHLNCKEKNWFRIH